MRSTQIAIEPTLAGESGSPSFILGLRLDRGRDIPIRDIAVDGRAPPVAGTVGAPASSALTAAGRYAREG